MTDSQSSAKHLAGMGRKRKGCSQFLCETGRAEWTNKEGRTWRFQPSHAERRSTPDHWTTDEVRVKVRIRVRVRVAAGAESNADLVTPPDHNMVLEELPLQ